MKYSIRLLVITVTVLFSEPVASLVIGPLHVHEGESVPHRDHENPTDSALVAGPIPIGAASQLRLTPTPERGFECPCIPVLVVKGIDNCRGICSTSRSPPDVSVPVNSPLLI